MADNLIDKYLGNPAGNPLGKGDENVSLLDRHLPRISNQVEEKERVIAPPISGLSPQETTEHYKKVEEIKNKKEPSLAYKAITLPVDAAITYGKDVYRHASQAGALASEGIRELTTNQSATGLGKAVMGAVGVPLSLITAPYEELTSAGNKLIPSAIPGLPTSITGTPISDKPFKTTTPTEIALTALPVGQTAKAIKSTIPSNQAINAIIDTIGGKDKLAEVVKELKSNPRLSIVDVVPATLDMAQKLITTEGQHINKFENFVNQRKATAKQSVGNITENNLGVPVNLSDRLDTMKANARAVGSKEINPVVTGAGPVDVTPVIKNIDDILNPGVQSVISAGKPLPLGSVQKELEYIKKFITDGLSQRTDAKTLHDFQSSLRATADDLLNSQSGKDRQLGYALMNMRNEIVNSIDKASGGTYKPALSKYRDEMQIQNAFQMGQLVTHNKLGRLEDTAEFWDKWAKGASKEELEAARDGVKLAIYHQLKAFKGGANKVESIAQVELNVDKLKSLFGEKEINQFQKLLNDERQIAVSNTELTGGSQTAMRMKGSSHVDLPVEKPPSGVLPVMAAAAEGMSYMSGGLPGLGATAVIGQRLASKAKHKFVDLPLAKAKNTNITDYLTATGPERDELIKILESQIPQPKLSLVSKVRLSLPTNP